MCIFKTCFKMSRAWHCGSEDTNQPRECLWSCCPGAVRPEPLQRFTASFVQQALKALFSQEVKYEIMMFTEVLLPKQRHAAPGRRFSLGQAGAAVLGIVCHFRDSSLDCQRHSRWKPYNFEDAGLSLAAACSE